ncbi:Glycine--tRNA ligase [Tepidanaerobacter acetatoxydans Re1]|uniref:Glycine--tRNA ligase n=1 Tax=Tepidanaerobacter acetatoxydans (strain DSM 21804 / JCM 16047 / Re1) TaxID=1209989 RepID=F4LW59_TEPAE|nr:glycine--tRNA ligase [Tepidanaerobacter acetatoxydans]AEE90835.1 glycyl-tRNA synthetase [Tepidanaerobacter acetatoxydans Re1]CCP25396.1 Glycine--tRNA ligase [Tepidanaerobacter acetatoxydans Re1]
MSENVEKSMNKIVSLCKRRGFIFQGSEIYGGLANTWDYGPLGIELKRNVKDYWWKKVVHERDDVVGLDSAILMHPKVWEASGHVAGFNDALIDCKQCKSRFRADHLIEDSLNIHVEGKSVQELTEIIHDNKIKCPTCGSVAWTEARVFNLMFKTYQGVTEDSSSIVYLRPETAQGIFVNFKNVLDSCRMKLPFGIAQIGKSFRNEITPGNFTFRTREFEQMELEFFVKPGDDQEWFEYWRQFMVDFFVSLGVKKENLRLRDHSPEELSHYSKGTTDLEYKFPFGWGELWGVANRTDYDLSRHMEYSGKSLTYFDPKENKQIVPYVVEPSLGADRAILAVLCDAYDEEEVQGDTRVVLHLKPEIAPIKCAVLPLSKKEPLEELACKVYHDLKKYYHMEYDNTGSIGKRYRRQDEIGTPFAVTIDFDSLEDNKVTIRDRDTMQQDRIEINQVRDYLKEKLRF